MKTVIIAYATLILVIVIVIINSLIIANSIEIIMKKLNDAPDSVDDGGIYEEIYKDFMKWRKYLSITVNHEDLTNIEEDFREILGAVSASDDAGLIIAKSRLIESLYHIKRLSGINTDSIF